MSSKYSINKNEKTHTEACVKWSSNYFLRFIMTDVMRSAIRATAERQRTVIINTKLSPFMGDVGSAGSVGTTGAFAASA